MENEDNIANSKLYYCYYRLLDTMDNFNQNAYIFRYMEFEHLISMLEKKTFYVAKKRLFPDPNESRLPLRSAFSMRGVGQIVNEEQSIRESIEWHNKKELYIKYSHLPTSCWTYQEKDNYLMWKSYTSSIGVRVKTTIGKLIESLDTEGYDILCGYMHYDGYGYGNIKKIHDCLFSKEKMYADEREFRFYFNPINVETEKHLLENDYVELKIYNSVNLFDEIIISPTVNTKVFKRIIEEYGFNSNIIKYSIQ